MTKVLLCLLVLISLACANNLRSLSSEAYNNSGNSTNSTNSTSDLPWNWILGIGIPVSAVLGGVIGYCKSPCGKKKVCENVLVGVLLGLIIFGLLALILLACFSDASAR
jgi:hypothetical protein